MVVLATMFITQITMAKFTFTKLSIPDVVLVEPTLFNDERGFFSEMYNKREFVDVGIDEDFVQDNFSFSGGGVVRGLHFSISPHGTSKLVRCTSGEIFDVAVDIRSDSETFGKWVSAVLSEQNHRMLFVPKGFAHGFCVMGESAGVSYKVTDFYYPESDAGIIFNDPDIAIDWPIKNPILSEKDKKLPFLKDLNYER